MVWIIQVHVDQMGEVIKVGGNLVSLSNYLAFVGAEPAERRPTTVSTSLGASFHIAGVSDHGRTR